MGRKSSTKICPVCSEAGLKRNGYTSGGKRRWRCTKCGASSTTAPRTDITNLAVFTSFLSWIDGGKRQYEIDGTATGRTARRWFSWCWNIPIPPPDITGEVHDQVFIDGTYLAYGWCLLVAKNNNGYVLVWQWCKSENSAAYKQLFKNIAPPRLITTDGAGGALKAIKETWPDTPIQRCLLHVHKNNRTDLTMHPKTGAGRALLELSNQLLTIENLDQARTWTTLLAQIHTEYDTWFKARTYATDNPLEAQARGKTRPNQWWYTHGRDRRVYHRLERLLRKGQLFAFLTTIEGQQLANTTNTIESTNAGIKHRARQHRGMTSDHLTAAIEWHLHTRTETPQTPREILTNWNQNGKPTRTLIPQKQTQPTPQNPKQYDSELSAEERLWTRKGRARRTT